MLFGPDGVIKRYETPQDILLEFFDVRMQFYHKRRAFLIQVTTSLSFSTLITMCNEGHAAACLLLKEITVMCAMLMLESRPAVSQQQQLAWRNNVLCL